VSDKFPVKSDVGQMQRQAHSISFKDLEAMEAAAFYKSDWEIVYLPTNKVIYSYKDGEIGGLFYEKAVNYARLIKKGVIFPPIIVSKGNVIIDGQCRHVAYRRAGRKKIPVLRAVGSGNGVILRDKVYKGGRFMKPNELFLMWVPYEY